MTWHIQPTKRLPHQRPATTAPTWPKNVRKGDSNSKPNTITMDSLSLRHLLFRVIVGDVFIYTLFSFLYWTANKTKKWRRDGDSNTPPETLHWAHLPPRHLIASVHPRYLLLFISIFWGCFCRLTHAPNPDLKMGTSRPSPMASRSILQVMGRPISP